MARFLMNVMLASGGYPWTVIRIRDRKSYLSALDRASIEMDIHPFTAFIVRRVQWHLELHDLTFPAPKESFVFERDIVFFYAQDGEACGAPSAGKPWTITSRETARINSRCSERTARTSSRRYGGNILLAIPKWMGLFSFTRTIYLIDDPRVSDGSHLHQQHRSCCAVHEFKLE
jgi:hypothetical protein